MQLLLWMMKRRERKENRERGEESFRYTCPVLQSTLQLMGCKARNAFEISKRVFELMKSECCTDARFSARVETLAIDASKGQSQKENDRFISGFADKTYGHNHVVVEKDDGSKRKPFELYKRRTTVVVSRKIFLDVVCDALAEYKYVGPNQRADLALACGIRERKESVTVLLCGTSSCGKSTLSALLGSRLGITTVVSTDSIWHMMRSFVDEKQNPLVWALTYHAGEYLDPEAVAAAKANKRKAKKLAGVSHLLPKDGASDGSTVGKSDFGQPEVGPRSSELISARQMAVEGFKAQSEMVIDSLDRLITAWEERKESVAVEGVHLSLNFVLKEEHSVQGSDEEVDEPPEMDSDEDLSDDSRKQIHEEMEGSVDEESTKSYEEYDDLAMQDIQENGYWSNDDEEFKDKVVIISRGN